MSEPANPTTPKYMQSPQYDIVTIGETMLRFTPDAFLRVEQAESLQLHVGGSESNTAVGLARLGMRVAWLSRLTNNYLGHRIERAIASHGVDTSHVVWTDRDRVGLYFLENGSPPRTSQVIYDRAQSAYARFEPTDLPSDLFQPGRSRWLHFTGISLWLSDACRRLIREAYSQAKNAGWKISFDVNHRSLLCDARSARAYCEAYVDGADLLFLPRRDAVHLWQWDEQMSDQSLMNNLLQLRGGKPTVMTLGSRGAMAADNRNCLWKPVEAVEPIGRLGGGDAFSAGFLSSWIDREDLAVALDWAVATARMKYSIPGDLPIIYRHEVERLLQGGAQASLVR
jgi:2-dehydro-3-deoxygluconokinase